MSLAIIIIYCISRVRSIVVWDPLVLDAWTWGTVHSTVTLNHLICAIFRHVAVVERPSKPQQGASVTLGSVLSEIKSCSVAALIVCFCVHTDGTTQQHNMHFHKHIQVLDKLTMTIHQLLRP